jgi:hypothetical protein
MSDEWTAIRKDSRKVSEGESHWKIENHFILVAERMPLTLYPGFVRSYFWKDRKKTRISECLKAVSSDKG